MNLKIKRGFNGYSLIETMAVISVLGIVMGLLYAYSNNGWKLFYQSYSRGLSQIKARLAVKVLSDELRDANKSRISINRGVSSGVPLPDDVKDNSPFIYFTKPAFYEQTGDVIAYDYVLYYFAKPKQSINFEEIDSRRKNDSNKYLILKVIRFINQSKTYTEDKEKKWPFLPPILEIYKSTLPEDNEFLETLTESSSSSTPLTSSGSDSDVSSSSDSVNQNDNLFLDHFAQLKAVSRKISISNNFTAKALTDPFTNEQASFVFGQDYKNDLIIKIKASVEETPLFFGLMTVMSEFEVKVTPRN